MLEVEKPADMKAHVGQQIGTSEWVLVDQPTTIRLIASSR